MRYSGSSTSSQNSKIKSQHHLRERIWMVIKTMVFKTTKSLDPIQHLAYPTQGGANTRFAPCIPQLRPNRFQSVMMACIIRISFAESQERGMALGTCNRALQRTTTLQTCDLVLRHLKLDAVLPTKTFLSKHFANEEESVVEVEVELLVKLLRSSRGGYNSALCKSLSVSRPMVRNLESKVTPVPPTMDKPNGFQQNAPGNASEMCQSDAIMSSEVPGEMECNQVERVCNEAPVFRVVLDFDLMPQNKAPNESVVLDASSDLVMPGSCLFASEVQSDEAPSSDPHSWLMAPRSGCSHPVVYSISKLAPVVADEVPVVVGPKLAPCPVDNFFFLSIFAVQRKQLPAPTCLHPVSQIATGFIKIKQMTPSEVAKENCHMHYNSLAAIP
ncbi:hypothetical protein Nepgr_021700 [Nepenthes gracilis]|uniref:Uncharacterized protein n=1 Tax=Nepenthes gracilis TaxID=150966 RepID=A0AAD3XXA6_NEPGR|nr:hypothetical protein Nepgr_021700 [Nepenthes gracilis]